MRSAVSRERRIQQCLTQVSIIVLLFLLPVCTSAQPRPRNPINPSRQELGTAERLEAEKRLWELGYWAGPADGSFDSASRHALVAFQKVERRPRTGNLTLDELNALRNARRPMPRHGRYAHVEIDLSRQVLFLIDETGSVMRILPVSTGNGQLYIDHGQIHRARTPTGTFKVVRKIKGWRLSSLGLMYYPSYVLNGIAIHGSFSIPTHPASHGCIRIPMFAAKELSALMPVGMEVILYEHQQSAASEGSGLQELRK